MSEDGKVLVLVLSGQDNIGTALRDLPRGTVLRVEERGNLEVIVADEVPFCHKVALRDIDAGSPIVKYGEVIGYASRAIPGGGLVHVHNVTCDRGHLRVAAGGGRGEK